MKQYITRILTIALLLSNSACQKDFLKESSQDLVRPTTTEALNQIMVAEAYPLSAITLYRGLDLMADEFQMDFDEDIKIVNLLNKYAPVFTWQPDLLDKMFPVEPGYNYWFQNYSKIKGCNVVLDNLEKVKGPATEKENMRGQALALRAFYFFNLVNLFAQPYKEGPELSTNPGIPLMLTAVVSDQEHPRATVKQVYTQIEQDLLAAMPLLDTYGTQNHIYRLNGTAVRFLLARLYLYMGQWDNCIRYADEVLQAKSSLQQYNSITSEAFGIVDGVLSPEVIWGFGDIIELTIFRNQLKPDIFKDYVFRIDQNFINTFDSLDLRLKFSFEEAEDLQRRPIKLFTRKKTSSPANNGNAYAFRTAEVYLNRAEAYIQKARAGDTEALKSALADINTLRAHRIRTDHYTAIDIRQPEALYTYYQAERRRELCLEGHRWFDLRRWGMPKLEHNYQLITGSPQTAILQQNDPRYTLRIPANAIELNSLLTQNP